MHSEKRPKVIICGAGIGGLTVAHELTKHGYSVTIYERNKEVGGLARSAYITKDGESYPAEYSWRVYGSGYKNLHRILSEIPLAPSGVRSVIQNLVKITTYILARYDRPPIILERGKKKGKVDWQLERGEMLKVLGKVLYCLTMSTARMDARDDLKWKDFCSDLSPEAQKYMVTFWAPVLGMDASFMSFPVIARAMAVILGGMFRSANYLFLMNAPTNDAWFTPWVEYLERTGNVTVRTEHEVKDFIFDQGKISGIEVLDKHTGESSTETADYVVCALPVEVIADFVSKNENLRKREMFKNLVPLAKSCHQIQLSVQVFFERAIAYHVKDAPIVYLSDSPWAIIIEPESIVWKKTHATDDRVQSVLSVGICVTDKPGLVHGKPFTECNREEIEDEVWEQMRQAFVSANITAQDGTPIERKDILYFYMWDSFAFDEKEGRVRTWEPKFSNNAGTLRYQPEVKTEIENLFFATGYTRTDRYIYSMESAAEAGIRAANEILRKTDPQARLGRVIPFTSTPFFLKPLRLLDDVLFARGLPHIADMIRGFGS